MKPSLSSLCQLAVSSVSEEYDCCGEESEGGIFAQDSCLKTATVQNGCDETQKFLLQRTQSDNGLGTWQASAMRRTCLCLPVSTVARVLL